MTSPVSFYRRLHRLDAAPRFSLPAYPEGALGVDPASGRNMVLVFYDRAVVGRTVESAADLTRQAATLLALSCERQRFAEAGATVCGISRQPAARHAQVASFLGLDFPLLSDESGDVGMEYGLLPENRWAGSSDAYDFGCRVFVIDRSGIVRHMYSPEVIVCTTHAPPPAVQAALAPRLQGLLGTPAVLRVATLVQAARTLPKAPAPR